MYFDLSVTTGMTPGKIHRLREDTIAMNAHPAHLLLGIIEGKTGESIEIDGGKMPIGYIASQLAQNAVLECNPQEHPVDIVNHVLDYLRKKGEEYTNNPNVFAVDTLLLQYDDRSHGIQFASAGNLYLFGKDIDGNIEEMAKPTLHKVNEPDWAQYIAEWDMPLGGFPNHEFSEIAFLSDGFFPEAISDADICNLCSIFFDKGHEALAEEVEKRTKDKIQDDATSILFRL